MYEQIIMVIHSMVFDLFQVANHMAENAVKSDRQSDCIESSVIWSQFFTVLQLCLFQIHDGMLCKFRSRGNNSIYTVNDAELM